MENFSTRFSWYPYTGEEAPIPLEDIEDIDDTEEEEEEEEDEDEVPDFMNYWNNVPRFGNRQMNEFNLD